MPEFDKESGLLTLRKEFAGSPEYDKMIITELGLLAKISEEPHR